MANGLNKEYAVVSQIVFQCVAIVWMSFGGGWKKVHVRTYNKYVTSLKYSNRHRKFESLYYKTKCCKSCLKR